MTRASSLPSVLITGTTGVFGRVLRYGLIKRPLGGEVVLHGRRHLEMTNVTTRSLDLSADPKKWDKMLEEVSPDVVLHLAGVTYTSGLDLEQMIAINADAACMVANAAAKAGTTHFLYASTAGVYGPQVDHLDAFREADCVNPQTDYARSKVVAEEALLDVAPKLGLKVTCLRYTTIGGSDILVKNALAAHPDAPLLLDQYEDGSSPERTYLGPLDLANIHQTLLQRIRNGNSLPPIMNIAARGSVQMHELLEALSEKMASQLEWKSVPAGSNSVRRCILDCGALETALNIRLPKTDADRLAEQISGFISAEMPY